MIKRTLASEKRKIRSAEGPVFLQTILKTLIAAGLRTARRLLLLAGLCLFHSAFVFAQSATATLSGTIADEQGAVVPGAEAKIANPATGFERTVVTNDNGQYVFAQLPPGSYTLTATRTGFATATFNEIILNVGDRKTFAIQLRVGQVGEVVNVTSEASLVDESPAVATVVDRQFVENIPLNGRSFNSLITLSPGVVLTGTSSTDLGQFSVNGQRPNTNYFSIDGVSANVGVSTSGLGQSASGSVPATGATGGTNSLVSVDALQEFRIQTSTFAAEFGRSPGAQVQLLTRSGTNEFHGNVFDYFRNDVFDANDWFGNFKGLARPPLRQNDFGGTFGGPLPLPHFGEGGPIFDLGRDRTFFFFSYEGLRLQQPKVGLTTVPSLCLRGRAACPAGVTPAHERLRPLLDAFPVPNGPVRGQIGTIPAGALAEFNSSYSNPSTLNATSIRIDHRFGGSITVFGRYNHAPSNLSVRGAGNAGTSLSRVSTRSYEVDTLTLGSTWVVSPSQSNELLFNYSRSTANDFDSVDSFGGAIIPDFSQYLPAPFTFDNGFLSYNFLNGNASYSLGLTVDNLQRQMNILDNYSITRGTHAIKFGVDYRRLSPVYGPRDYTQLPTISTVAALTAGNVTGGSISSGVEVALFFTNFSAYAQDTWKLGRLILTYGVRWDVNPPPTGREGLEPYAVSGFNLNDFSTLALAPRGTPLWDTTWNNFAPRLGVAYQLNQTAGRETVLRGGVGIFYDTGNGNSGSVAVVNAFPFSATRSIIPPPPPTVTIPYPLSPTAAAPPPINTVTPATGTQSVIFDPELKLPRVYQWNVAVEQSLGAPRSLTVSYVGAAGRDLVGRSNVRNINSRFSAATAVNFNRDTSDYHALQMQFQQRLTDGLQALASYTWGHSIDTFSTDFGANNIIQGVSQASSDFDIRHAFNGAVTYNIPTPKFGSVGKAILGNWSVDTIVTARTAPPVDVTVEYFRPNPVNLFIGNRPNLVAGVPVYIDDPNAPGGRRFNPDAFMELPAAVLTHGTLPRNALRGFGAFQIDLALRRQFSLTEKVKLQLRAEAFNLFNRPNFGAPVSNLRSADFGRSTAMLGRSLSGSGGGEGFNPLYQVGGPRSMQFAAKLSF